jgi:hypothetical protein
MTIPTNESVDVRSISDSDTATALATIAAAFVAARIPSNDSGVTEAIDALNRVANIARRIHL